MSGSSIGGTLGTALGVALAPETGGASLLIPAAAGAAGAAGGGALTGSKNIWRDAMLGGLGGAAGGGLSGLTGGMGGLSGSLNGYLPSWAGGAASGAGAMGDLSAPVVGTGVNVAQGKDLAGNEVTPASISQDLLTPMSLSDIYASMKEQGVPAGTALGVLSIFGMSLQNYDALNRHRGTAAATPAPTTPVYQAVP